MQTDLSGVSSQPQGIYSFSFLTLTSPAYSSTKIGLAGNVKRSHLSSKQTGSDSDDEEQVDLTYLLQQASGKQLFAYMPTVPIAPTVHKCCSLQAILSLHRQA